MKRAALYVRVSTQEQKNSGLSVDSQIDALEKYCEEQGYTVAGIYNDAGISARKKYTKRPALLQLLEDCKKHEIDIILFTRLDRWFRAVAGYYEVQNVLDACKVPWRAIWEDYETETSQGIFKVNIMLSVAQAEADRDSEKIRSVMEFKRNNKEYIGGKVPVGYRIEGKKIVKDEKTYRIVVDGQQRLTAILKFVRDELPLEKPYTGELTGCRFSDLPSDVHDDFLRYKIDINKYTVQLNKQELRKADFPGDFINLSEKLSENYFFVDAKIFTVRQRRRMLDVEFIEELLTVILEGIQSKKDYIDQVCEKYMHMENLKQIETQFNTAIADIATLFDEKIYPIGETRFRQKSDFYSLFACVIELRENGYVVINKENLTKVRENLKKMDEEISPSSSEPEYLEYATRCLSDANSDVNRIWRKDFIKRQIADLYYKKGE